MADVFEVLSDPTRRRVLELLRDGERSVNELVAEVDIHQPGVSRHLRILHEAGLVQARKDGQRRLYSLVAEPLRTVDAWVASYRALWDKRFDRLADTLAQRRKEHE